MNWYQKTDQQTLSELGSSAKGLTQTESRRRLEKYGENTIADEETIHPFRIFIHQFQSPLIYILLIASIVTFFLEEYIDTSVILAIVILNAIIGFIQEFRAEKSVQSLKELAAPKARVLREGHIEEIASQLLVPGEIVVLTSGSRIPADLRLIDVNEFRVQESLLTGESDSILKNAAPLSEENLNLGDQINMAFIGTTAVSGRAHGVVVETGKNSQLGQLAQEIEEAKKLSTPLELSLDSFGKFIGYAITGFCVLFFALGMFRGEDITQIFMVAVATAVSAIPEGLPVAVTIAMAIGVARMAKRNAIVRYLPSVETLGSTTVICSDKTGTLTKNEMTVKNVFDGKKNYQVSGTGYEINGEITCQGLQQNDNQSLQQLLMAGLLCNEASYYFKDEKLVIEGDPTEAALLIAAEKSGLSQEKVREKYPMLAMLPFESERGMMASLHSDSDEQILFVKGSPEKIIDLISASKEEKEVLYKQAINYASQGLRVLALAQKSYPTSLANKTKGIEKIEQDDLKKDFRFLGLTALLDPPRPEAIESIEKLKMAGIQTKMVTGDHAITARSIAAQLQLMNINQVIEGSDLTGLSDEQLEELVDKHDIFARVAPAQKLEIVNALKRIGQVVAVTGDGVNDAPALKSAHVGVAMGKQGTDVAKEASDIVLADDNFASILSAVEEGRVVYSNIRKVIVFLSSCGLGELIAIFATSIMALPIPYLPAQILWLNLVTNGFQDVALAFEGAETDVLKEPPRSPKEGLFNKVMIRRTLMMGVVMAIGTVLTFVYSISQNDPIEKSRTLTLTVMVLFQLFQALNSRSLTQSVFKQGFKNNPFLIYSLIAAWLAHVSILYIPAFQYVFRTVPISLNEWLVLTALASSVVIIVELQKLYDRFKNRNLASIK